MTPDRPPAGVLQRRQLLPAPRLGEGTASMEFVAGRAAQQPWHFALDGEADAAVLGSLDIVFGEVDR